MEEQINPPRHTAVVSGKQQLSEKVFLFDLKIPDEAGIHFTPGQFINVTVGENTRRQYSIASSPSHTNTIQLLVDIAPGGAGSIYFSNLKENETVEISAPMGKFGLHSLTGPIVFLATGTGLAPFKAMIDYLVEQQEKQKDQTCRSIFLYLGFRYAKDIFWKDYLESLEVACNNFHLQIILSKPEDTWNGPRGHVQVCMNQKLLTNPNAHFYLCGGNTMVQGVLEYLRKQKISEDHIHFEPF